MFKVSVVYAKDDSKHFDLEYYTGAHAQLVMEKLTPLGLVRFEVDSGFDDSSDIFVRAEMLFESAEHFGTAMESVGADLMADVQNFTDMDSVIQTSAVVASLP